MLGPGLTLDPLLLCLVCVVWLVGVGWDLCDGPRFAARAVGNRVQVLLQKLPKDAH